MKKGLLIILGLFILLQFFHPEPNQEEIDAKVDMISIIPTSDQEKYLLQRACYDCHSSNTNYNKWYLKVQPVAWWTNRHVEIGKGYLNFNKWGTYDSFNKEERLEDCIQELKWKKMPMEVYISMHPEANLNDKERDILINYFKKQLKKEDE